jgi:propionate catabolism operon transcriptional regulator
LDNLVAEGRFRADLYYRLSVLRMTLPALRERTDDLVTLAEWFLKNALAEIGAQVSANLHAELLACANTLQAWHWPGNVRELRNLMQRVALFLAVEPLQALTPAFLVKIAPELSHKPSTQATIGTAASPKTDLEPAAAAETVEQVLARFDGNRAAAADHLGISRTTLWRRLKT